MFSRFKKPMTEMQRVNWARTRQRSEPIELPNIGTLNGTEQVASRETNGTD